ncbi:MAG TPA: histidine kinase dimerization/phospho-acceptor domain-containing protein [Thermoanaerobaculia bacterium]|nr:histidine kinase dimerization/phospho-acceptor domain-containing protein [Thermoanaerobaculia bacterium]
MEPWLEAFARANSRRSVDTAHDLKTPLNVAVLNLELLRMRVAKLAHGSKDEKIAGYTAAIETELRRMARIFDAFFLLSTPPKNEGEPKLFDASAVCRELMNLQMPGATNVRAHESRIREAVKLFLQGASKVLKQESRQSSGQCVDKRLTISISGQMIAEDLELEKIFKFYYTDRDGAPDLSLAAARLIVETYGGELDAVQERDKVTLRLSLPLGDP